MNFDFFPNGIRKIVYNDDIDNSEDDVGDKRPEGRKNVKDVKVVIREFRCDDCNYESATRSKAINVWIARKNLFK